jgi:hypothetical protein
MKTRSLSSPFSFVINAFFSLLSCFFDSIQTFLLFPSLFSHNLYELVQYPIYADKSEVCLTICKTNVTNNYKKYLNQFTIGVLPTIA